MKLNYDCLRKILLTIESDVKWNENLTLCYIDLYEMKEALKDFSKADIAYASKMAIEADLIEANIIDCDNGIIDISYYGLTYEGHQFLDTVREKNVWEKTKQTISSFGGASLSIIKGIAAEYLTTFIKSHLP